jgi:hypothetical protein
MHFTQMHLVRTSALLMAPYNTFNTQYPVPNEMNSGSCTVDCRVNTIYLPVSLKHKLQHEIVMKAWRLKFWAKGQLSSFEWHYATPVLLRASSLHVAEISTALFPYFDQRNKFYCCREKTKTDRLDRGRLCWYEIGEQFLMPGIFFSQMNTFLQPHYFVNLPSAYILVVLETDLVLA